MAAVDDIPEFMYLTKNRHEWPYHIFESLDHAIARVHIDPENIQCWKVKVTPMAEMTYVPPAPPRLE